MTWAEFKTQYRKELKMHFALRKAIKHLKKANRYLDKQDTTRAALHKEIAEAFERLAKLP